MLEMNDWLYCSVCGAKLILIENYDGGYDRHTGQKITIKMMQCPNKTEANFHDSYIVREPYYTLTSTSPKKVTWFSNFVDNFFHEL